MQVLYNIITKVELPSEFISSYIKHCINEYRQDTKKDSKERSARIIAFFVNNLLENEHIVFDSVPQDVKIYIIYFI
jgi:hypothetical protein